MTKMLTYKQEIITNFKLIMTLAIRLNLSIYDFIVYNCVV